MVPNQFFYVGKVATDKVRTKGRHVRNIAWCPNPKKYAVECQDVIAVTGNFGTDVYYRRKTTGKISDIDTDWALLFNEPELKGQSCAWNPSSELDAGDLAVITEPDGDAAKVHVVKHLRSTNERTKEVIYNAADDNSWVIPSFCWCFDGKSMLIFTDQSSSIHYMIWNSETRLWTTLNIPFAEDGVPCQLVGCVPSTREKNIFSVAGPCSFIKVFKKSSPLDPNRQWDEICSWPKIIGISSMAFSSNGQVLAALRTNGNVTVLRLTLPALQQAVGYTIALNNPYQSPSFTEMHEFKGGNLQFMSWSEDNFLVVSGSTLDSVQVMEFAQEGGITNMIYVHLNVLQEGMNSTSKFNQVKQLLMCPHRMGLAFLVIEE